MIRTRVGPLALSGLLATVTAHGGPLACVTTAFEPHIGRAMGWCFLGGVIPGAPVVCLIGGRQVGVLVFAGRSLLVGAVIVIAALYCADRKWGVRVPDRVVFGGPL